MTRLFNFTILLAALFSLSACQTINQPTYVEPGATLVAAQQAEQRAPVTILISIDGFRPDYLERGITPNLNALAKAGVTVPMRSSFPTKTFPNHYTLVTGKRPDTHGVVGNTMRDKARPDEVFTMSNKDPFWWSEAEPIWVTAENQGIRAATMFWPGSEVPLDGVRPSDWWPFSQELSDDRRVRAVVDWMRRPAETRPQLVTLYFDTVDTAGHYYGPGPSDELHGAIAQLDIFIGILVADLKELGQPANFVIVSDHGMAETSPERVIDLDAVMPRDKYVLVTDGTYVGVDPLEGDMAALTAAFVRPHDHMECWEKGDIPARFQYGKNPRVPAIICVVENGWKAYQDIPEWMTGIGGDHGYDNMHPDMAALFIASGPAIRKGAPIAPFDNVDIYGLLAVLSGIVPGEYEGSTTSFDSILTGENP